MNLRNVVIVGVLIGIIFSTGFVFVEGSKTDTIEKPISENNPLSSVPPIIDQLQMESKTVKSDLSGEVMTCTNATDAEQVIDLRLSNPGEETKYITVYPMNKSLKLLPNEIKRIDLFLLKGTDVLTLISNNGEELELHVPPCVYRGGSAGDIGVSLSGNLPATSPAQTEPATTPAPTVPTEPTNIPEFPTIVFPALSTLGLLLIMRKMNKK